MKAAIATVAIGDSYQRHYAQIFQPSVQRYAERHGYELLLFDQHLCAPEFRDPSTVAFTKLLIPFQPGVQPYERLMVLDADILIHRDTPPFTTLDLDTGIGIVDEWSQPTPAERVAYQEAQGWETSPRDYYALAGLTLQTDVVLSSGMFICSPARHSQFFEEMVERRIAAYLHHPRGFHYEQSVFGYELQQAGLHRLLPAAWNRIWPVHRPRGTGAPSDRFGMFRTFIELYAESFLLHLCAGQDHDFAYLLRHR